MKRNVVAAFVAGTVLGGLGFTAIGSLAQDVHSQHGHHGHFAADPAVNNHPFVLDMDRDMAKMMTDMHAPGYTGDWDIDFLAMMIPHHQGAVDMAKLVLVHGKDPLTRVLAEEIIASQRVEIEAMTARLEVLRRNPADPGPEAFPALSGTRGLPAN